MNWFERYGIAGIYLMGLTFLYIEVYFPAVVLENAAVILGVVVTFFLPLGYILSAFARWFAYLNPARRSQIHSSTLRRLKLDFPQIAESFNLEKFTELEAEMWLAMRFTDKVGGEMDKQRKTMMEWSRGKLDLLTLDLSMMMSSLFFLFEAVLTFVLYVRRSHGFNLKLCILATLVVFLFYCVLLANRMLTRAQLLSGYMDFFPRYLTEVFKWKSPTGNAI
ncbi:MAG: hypothetical protein ABSF91_12130 [Bacteroidota bacterium]|jgi:hypothetical protein